MATKISKPPKTAKRKTDKLGEPPSIKKKVSQNLQKNDSTQLVQFSFATDPEFKREYRMFAAEHDMSMTEVLKKSFEHYKKLVE